MIQFVVALSMLLFADISSFTKEKKNISQYRIISVIQRTTNIINCAKEGASLITKQGAVKKKICICFDIKATQTKFLKTMFENMLPQMT